MKKLGVLIGAALLGLLVNGCVEPVGYGASYGVYGGEYPSTYYGGYSYPAYSYYPTYGYYHRWAPYDRDHYWDRGHYWRGERHHDWDDRHDRDDWHH